MANATLEKPLKVTQSYGTDSTGFGAYGKGANAQVDLTPAVGKPPETKADSTPDFTDSDKRWLKDLGITTTDPNSYHKVWQTEAQKYDSQHVKWSNSMQGRLGMRTISRGVVGAVFYAAAQMYGGKAMEHYSPDNAETENALQFIAKLIDKTAGKAISKTVKTVSTLTGSTLEAAEARAVRSVTFRDTLTRSAYGGKKGQSLGHEAVAVTFDFAAMSFGDYMTRYVLGLMDPNAKKHWMKDGHLDVPGGLKDLMSNIFRAGTYAMGEDIAVAVEYVYGMAFQRFLIEKSSPGAKYDLDRSRNGASLKVDKLGKVIGNYEMEGMLDLVGRFSWYNVGTKIFRDAYSKLQSKAEHLRDRWKAGDHSLPLPTFDPHDITPDKMLHAVAGAARYVLRTTIKVMSYMIPAATTFALIRTPQTKSRALAINPELGVLGRMKGGSFKTLKPGSAAHASDMKDGNMPRLFFSEAPEVAVTGSPFTAERADAFSNAYYDKSGVKAPLHNAVTNPIGDFNYKVGTRLTDAIGSLAKKLNITTLDPKTIERFVRTYANASLAYTPYFMAKTDILSAEWDNNRMDMAIDRTLDGAGHANWNEFKTGVAEIMRATMREPFTDPERELRAQKARWSADPEHRSNEAYQFNGVNYKHAAGEPPHTSPFADEGLKPKKITPETFTRLKAPASWAEQQAMRKFEEADLQSQSVH